MIKTLTFLLGMLGAISGAVGNTLSIEQFSTNTPAAESTNYDAAARPHLAPRPTTDVSRTGLFLLSTGDVRDQSNRVIAYKGTLDAGDHLSPIEILASDDKANIVVLVNDTGPVFSSTDFGGHWEALATVGVHDFPLTLGADGTGYYVQATLQTETPPPLFWTARARATNGDVIVLSGETAQPVPALTVRTASRGVTCSWPAAGATAVLQSTPNVRPYTWADVAITVRTNSSTCTVAIPSAPTEALYRLRLP